MSTLPKGLPAYTHDAVATASAALPPRRVRGLANVLVDHFCAQVRDRVLSPGDKLPTESELMRVHDVSRTVVREALSKLQAAGLVETRHGIGTFVLPPRAGGVFRLDPSELAASVDVLAVLELRISLETESAGLAAQRRTDEHLAAMRNALDDFARSMAEGGDAVTHDFRFHLQIAQATGNPYFADIMNHLGTTLIPRTRIAAIRNAPPEDAYLHRVNREHEEIFMAIARQDPESARAAMRIHLTNSRERLRLAQQAAKAG